MEKLFYFLLGFFLLGVCQEVFSQAVWDRQNSGTSSDLNGVFFTSENTGFAVGLGGTILRTTDAGQNWSRQNSGTSSTLYSVYFIDDDTGVAVGSGGTILRTTNGGQSWSRQNSGTPVALYDVVFPTADIGFAVGLDGDIFRSTDGGQNWTFQNSGTSSNLLGVSFTDANTGTAVGIGGTILRTTNGGQTWSRQNSGASSNLNAVHFTDADRGTAVGLGGAILRTTNGGQTWTRQNSGTPVNLNGVYFTSTDIGTAVGQDGDIFRTTNGGQTWTFQDGGTSSHLNGVFFTDANKGTAVGIGGTILRTVPCNFSLSPGDASFTPAGGTGSVNITTSSNCIWTAHTNAGWITITSGGSGQGSGTVGYSIAVNNNTASRTGTMTIAGQTFTVTQSGCTFTISPTNASFTTGGGTGSVTVSSQAGCSWTAQTNADWITITSGESGQGDGTVNYSVAVNDNFFSRTGTITIAGQRFTVSQSGCTYSLSLGSADFPATGGTGSVEVTAPATCSWTAQSTTSWITVTSGSSGRGNGTVNYSVAVNEGAGSRRGGINIAGQAFIVTQAGASPSNRPPVVDNPIADLFLRAGDSPFILDLEAAPSVFSDPDGDPLTYTAASSAPTLAEVSVSGTILTVTPLSIGTAMIAVTARDETGEEAETTFEVTIATALPACWEVDDFDNLNAGSLDGQNGWSVVSGRTAPQVVADPGSPGQALLLDPQQGQTVIINKVVNDQSTGLHSIKLNVRTDGNPTDLSLAKLEIRTSGNPNWDKKFQLYFGAHMRLNFGPTQQDAIEFLSSGELINGRNYLVEAIVDLNTNLVDVLLDGETRLEDIQVGPGAITDISLSAWDRPGRVYLDDLEFCRATMAQPGECPVTSFFDVDGEDWSFIEDVTNLRHVPEDGNPGGYLSATDIGTGQLWYWRAPAKFLGNVSCAYGRALNFDLRHFGVNHNLNRVDIILEGAGLKLVFDTPYNPDENWTSYSVLLHEDAGWNKNSLGGDAPTLEEMTAVLASLTDIFIRGEFSSIAGDICHLDNVVLGGAVSAVGPVTYANLQIENHDGQIEPGEQVNLLINLRNQGVLTAEGITGTLSSPDPNVTVLKDSSDWANLPPGADGWSLEQFSFEVSSDFTGSTVISFSLTVTADNGGPWTSTFDLLVSSEATALEEPAEAASGFELLQNQPNPFQTETSIGYRIPRSIEVTLEVYNLMGQRVHTLVNEKQPAGNYSVGWDGRDFRGRKLEGGVYLYWLKAGEFRSIRKLILIGP